ncbi:MAG: hypothetical protein DWQ04_24990, partial [Chloroflexi bacterium]
MRRRLLILFVGFLLVIVAMSTSTLLANPSLVQLEPAPTPELVPIRDGVVVRVYFDDLETAYQIASSFEPMESNYELGYLVLSVSNDEYNLLLETGMRVEVDNLRMLQIVQPGLEQIQTIPGYSCYRTVEETFAAAQAIVTNHPTLATWTDVGNSWEKTNGLGGYDMMV